MQTIILTGSTGGLGIKLAEAISKRKCGNLICIYRNEDKFQKMYRQFSENIYPYKTFEKDDYKSLMSVVNDNFGNELVLILNAFSITPLKRIGEFSAQEINHMIDGNLKQNILLLNTIIQLCRKQALALKIINLDSGAADFPLSGWGNYCAAKAYMNSFLAVLALENPAYKIVSFDPGVMDTDMQKKIRETSEKIFEQVQQFINYKTNHELKDPYVIAQYIVDQYITDWKAQGFRERHRE